MGRTGLCAALASLAGVVPLAASAQAPVGGEFQVNTYTTAYQYSARVVPAADGGFVVTWSSYGSFGDDTSAQSVQGQRHTADGSPAGGQFQVNSYTADNQRYPHVGSAGDGGFVVVWDSLGSVGTDTNGYSIQGQRYAADGSAQAAQFQVNTFTTGNQRRASVAGSGDGSFVVVWTSLGSAGTDTSSYSIQGQRFDASGAVAGTQFQVNSYTTGLQFGSAVAAAPEGGFLVVWQSNGSPGTDSNLTSIQGQRYAANGSPQGAQFQVNTWTTGSQVYPAAAIDADGDFVVVWSGAGSFGNDLFGSSIQGQRFDSGGAAAGTQFQVNSYTSNDQQRPAVAATGGGQFVVVWESRGSPGTDTSSFSIQGQHFAADGSPQGDQFQVNTDVAYGQIDAGVATHASGAFVVVWQGYGNPGVEGSDIHGQRYSVPVSNEVPALSSAQVALCATLLLALGRRLRRRARMD